MRRHDHSRRCARSHAWLGLVLFAAAAAFAARPATADDGPGEGVAPDAESRLQSREPVELSADRVRTWNQGGARWVHLSGRAAILQGLEAHRGGDAVVRLDTSQAAGGAIHRLDVYVEPGQGGGAPRRFTLETRTSPRLNAYVRGGLTILDAAPAADGVLARSGLLKPGAVQTADRSEGGAKPSQIAPALRPFLVELPAEAPQTPPPIAQVAAPPIELPDAPPRPERKPRARLLTVLTDPIRASGPYGARDSAVATSLRKPSIPTDVEVLRAQSAELADAPTAEDGALPPPVDIETPPLETAPAIPRLPEPSGPSTELEPLPDGEPAPDPAPVRPAPAPRNGQPAPVVPILPDTQRVTRISPRNSSLNFKIESLPRSGGFETVLVRGGVHIVTESPKFGIIDITADNAIIWRKVKANGENNPVGPNGEFIEDARTPLEVYLEGDVVVRQDEQKVAGNGDQKTYRARSAYFDVLNERFIGLDAELEMFAPGLVAPARVLSPRIEQYRPYEATANDRWRLGLPQIRADQTMTTGSRFPKPGYRFTSRSVDIYRVLSGETEPNSGRDVGDKSDPNAPQDLTWKIDARRNIFWMGPVPVFYWPRVNVEAEDLEPPLRQITFRTNNYFGQQVLSDWNGFRLIGVRKPKYIDSWNVDLDYLSARTKKFPALGSELGWFGADLINDLSDPYGRLKGVAPTWTSDYFGYFDIWGLYDQGRDTLGSGPAIITNNRAAGNVGYQRGGGGLLGGVPAFQNPRLRSVFRHMQRLIPDDDDHVYEDFRAQLEFGYYTDRYFVEEYYKRLNDTGMDHETLLYLIRQRQNWAWTLHTEGNLMPWQTESQWLPKADYYRFGDSLLDHWFSYFQHSGIDYANVHTANEVNNPYIFAFIPYDPISNTSGSWSSGRAYTNHELDMPLNFGDVFRVTPYAQGQLAGWNNQINGDPVGRMWGAVGARADVMAWKAYPWIQSETLNVHGINHKIDFQADYRNAWANVALDRIGVQDDLDDNSYESVRRYFALTNYAGGLLPAQYDPRHLILRRAMSPISGTNDVQGSMETLHLGIHQRLQTKRGPDGRRRIIDYMTLDLDTTYFPNASRDNFGKPWGQNMYNWQWFLGDRTSIISYGWFEFFNITGQPIYKTNIDRHNDPFGINVVTSGVQITRPPRGSAFIGYSLIDTGPIHTSALTTSLNYWMSPKWYGTYSTMYDFGNAILLAAMFSLTRIGPDYLTSVGLTVDPQRQSYMFALQISPRLSPNTRFGSGVGLSNFDSRFAPTQ